MTWRSSVIAVLLMVSPRTVSAQAAGDPEPGEADPLEASSPEAGSLGEAPPEPELAAEADPATELELAVEQPSPEPAEDEILVTGTRIRAKTAFAPSAPVEVIDRKQLERTGAKNLADVIQYLTGTQGSGTQGGTGIGVSSTTSSAVNLRGLGVGATLVLVNGRRLNPAGSALGNAHFGDLSTIPLAAVERIEILKAGASAIYGADAVGGVVNLITRRNWDGARVAVDAQTTSRFDHQELTATAGFGAVSEHGRVMVALSYFWRNELLVPERYAPKDKYVGGFYPPSYVNLSNNMRMPDPICATRPDLCTQYYGSYVYLFPNTERPNAFGSAEYDIGDHVTAFAELGISRLRGDSIHYPSFTVLTPVLTVPSDHVDNPFPGRPKLALSGAVLGDPYGPNRQTSSDDSFRAVLGLRGDLAGLDDAGFLSEWKWEAYASWGISRYRESVPDNLGDALQLALNSCSDPANLQNCFNPFYSAWDGTGTPNTREVINRFRSRQVILADHALQTYNLGFDGPVLQLPGGPLSLAFGGEIRREWRVTEFDHDATQLRFGFLVGNTDSTAERYIYGGYLEARWPFLDGLELQTAARLEHYTDTDEMALSPFAGLTLTPAAWFGSDSDGGVFQRLQLRANASRAFRAPTVTNTYPGYGTATAVLSYTDPSGMMQMSRAPVHYYGNPELTPETAVTLSAGLVWAPVRPLQVSFDYWYYNYKDRIQSQNPQRIVSEHQAAVAAGEVGTPDQVTFDPTTNVLLGVNSYAINLDEPIITDGFDFAVTLRVDGSDFGGSADDFGQFSLSAEGTYLIEYTVPRAEAGAATALECDSPDAQAACDVSGKRNFYIDAVALPRVRANFPLVWTFSGHSLSAIGHFISGFVDDYRDPTGKPYVNTPAWVSLDLQYAYTLNDVIGKRVEMRVGCQNVFDRMPPTAVGPQVYFVPEVHDPRGALFYASLGAEF